MTEPKLRRLIDEAIQLDREIETLKADLDEIETQLKEEAESRDDEHQPTDGGGWSWTAEGADGHVCRVTREGDKLKSSVGSEKDVAALKDVCGTHFADLFSPALSYRPIDGIRDKATARLGPAQARKLIKLITGAGRVRVAYETKEVTRAQS